MAKPKEENPRPEGGIDFATLFLLYTGVKGGRPQREEICAQVGKYLTTAGYPESNENDTDTTVYWDPTSAVEDKPWLNEYRETVYVQKQGSVSRQEERLEQLGISIPTVATLGFYFSNPANMGQHCESAVRPISLEEIESIAEQIADDLGLDFLLAKSAADIERGKISMTRSIHEQIQAAKSDRQPKNSYFVYGGR